MQLALDTITLGVPDAEAAYAFYTAADVHGTGHLTFEPVDELAREVGSSPTTTGFRGYVLSSIFSGPSEVEALLAAASDGGAAVIKPAKKQFFGEFAASYRAPDGTVWKLAAASKKDLSPVPDPPVPVETAIYLGVAAPKASKMFYEALGMQADHDYGNKFVDFVVADGASRLGLLPRDGLAKDVGVEAHGDGFTAAVLTHSVASREEVDALVAAAVSAGGQGSASANLTEQGAYAGYFSDPDGYHWKVTSTG